MKKTTKTSIKKTKASERKTAPPRPPRKKRKVKISIGKIFVGIILITIGLLYLAKNIGLIPVEFGFEIYELWPLLIVFAGLLLAKRRWISILIGIITTVLVLGILGLMMFGGRYFTDKTTTDIPLEISKANNIKSAIITIDSGVGDLTITGGSQKLIEGNLNTNYTKINIAENVENKVQETYIGLAGNWTSLFSRKISDLNLQLNSKIPLEFHLKNGPSSTKLDFSKVKTQFIDIDTKASSLELIIGDNVDENRVKIEADTSSIDIFLPKTIGANLVLDTGLMSSETLTEFTEVSENKYQSTNYETVEKFVDIYLDLSMSDVNIEWI